jgi:hypothetical protein
MLPPPPLLDVDRLSDCDATPITPARKEKKRKIQKRKE